MTNPKMQSSIVSADWGMGRRVSRSDKLDHQELGTIVAANGKIKVLWDSGRTSYCYRNVPANLQLEELPQ
jgi:hypothetical protein